MGQQEDSRTGRNAIETLLLVKHQTKMPPREQQMLVTIPVRKISRQINKVSLK